jgi:TPR repeat protein
MKRKAGSEETPKQRVDRFVEAVCEKFPSPDMFETNLEEVVRLFEEEFLSHDAKTRDDRYQNELLSDYVHAVRRQFYRNTVTVRHEQLASLLQLVQAEATVQVPERLTKRTTGTMEQFINENHRRYGTAQEFEDDMPQVVRLFYSTFLPSEKKAKGVRAVADSLHDWINRCRLNWYKHMSKTLQFEKLAPMRKRCRVYQAKQTKETAQSQCSSTSFSEDNWDAIMSDSLPNNESRRVLQMDNVSGHPTVVEGEGGHGYFTIPAATVVISAGAFDRRDRLAAAQGHAGAQYQLAECFSWGMGTARNNEEAARLYRLAADQGYAGAQFELAECYRRGIGVTEDAEEAARLYRLAADRGHPMAQDRLAADQGDVGAQYALAECYRYGIGVTEDAEEAARLYRLAADQGDADAHYALAECYRYGIGVSEDAEEAARFYRLAADQRHDRAQYKLAECCRRGIGVTEDAEEAARLYRLAADRGHPMAQDRLAADQGDVGAQYALAECYRYGIGVTEDAEEAARLYRLAADQGDADAQYALAECYRYGTGVTEDAEEAARLCRLAADQGFD